MGVIEIPDMKKIITLTTDFGLKDPYVGALKGAVLSINPRVEIIDITHLITPGNIIEGAFVLKDAFGFFPKGTIHVGVVDPGVGGVRKPILIETERYLFVGPDNGLFTQALEKEKVLRIVHLTKKEFFLKDVSNTFHGRDIFGPVASHLSLGVPPGSLGGSIENITELTLPKAQKEEGALKGEVIYIDSFGNLMTNIRKDDISSYKERALEVTVMGKNIGGIKKTYADAEKGALVALFGSSNCLEIAVNSGSASKVLGASVGERVVLRVVKS